MLICIIVLLGLVIHLYNSLSECKEMIVKIVDIEAKMSDNAMAFMDSQVEVNRAMAEYIVELEEHLSDIDICIVGLIKGEQNDC